MSSFKTYVVGGAVRDALLGLPVKDKDYVVVGATPDDLLAAGFTPVGKDFPVFLHPDTHEEYALARTERKTAPGYAGFAFHAAPDVTLEQDLLRRDLTINAIAQTVDGQLIDPHGGQKDIEARCFRHVSPAFAEDPVRILRIARFAARFTDFTVVPETLGLMRQMVSSGEVDALVSERVWQELARGLMEVRPSRMFEVLRDCGALVRILPELDALAIVSHPNPPHPAIDSFAYAMRVIDYAAQEKSSLAVRFAALLQGFGKGRGPSEDRPAHIAPEVTREQLADQVCRRLKLPNEVRELALLAAREQGNVLRATEMSASALVSLFERCDAFRKPARFSELLKVCECDHRVREGRADHTFPHDALVMKALIAAQAVNAGRIASEVTAKHPERPAEHIAAAVHTARVHAVGEVLSRA